MSLGARCNECGATLPADSAGGLCGQCLLRLALENADAPDGGQVPPVEPESNQVGTEKTTLVVRPSPTEKAGDRISRYKLLQQIGEGGFGVVYMAQQEEPVRRRVALKIIKLGMDTRQVVARFEAERQALALMDHPNVAKVLDGGATETGRPFFVMELVHGIKITEYCDQNSLSAPQRLELFMQVCRAIQHAHQKGIIHRDIKPSNILVALQDGVPVPKIIDFGIAKATQQELTEQTVFTQFGQFLGTPAYMSPEQAEMSGLDVDTRSDIYSLGVLLYELLTGKTPFDNQELLAAGLEEMRRRIREKEPARPSTRLNAMLKEELTTTAKRRHVEAPKLLKLVRGDLDWIVMKCLEKDRTRRYETANGLAMDLLRYLEQEPVVARPPSRLYRFQKLVRRNKVLFGAAAATGAALVVGLGIANWSLVREREAHRQAHTEAAKSRRAFQFLQAMLNGVGPSKARGRDTEMLREILDDTARSVGTDLKQEPEVEAEVRNTLGDVYLALGEHEKAETMIEAALAIRRKVLGNRHPDVAASLNSVGNVLSARGQLTNAETAYREALEIRKKSFGAESAEVATILNDLGAVLELQFRLSEAEDTERRALALRLKLFPHEHSSIAETLNNLGSILLRQGRYAEVESILRTNLSMLPKLVGPIHPQVADTLNNLGFVLQKEGKLAEAEERLSQALEMERQLHGPEHPLLADCLANLANVLRDQGKPAAAEPLYRNALAMRRNIYGENNRYVVASLNTLARLLRDEGKLPEAEQFAFEATEAARVVFGPTDSGMGTALDGLASVLYQEHKLDPAEVAARQCLDIFEKETPDHWQTFEARVLLGGILLAQKKHSDAEPLLLSGYEGLEKRKAKIPAEWRPRLKQAAQSLVDLYEATDRPDQAASWKERLKVFDKAPEPKGSL